VIVVQGHLDEHWREWFDDMAVTPLAGGRTELSGTVVDMAALHGILTRIRDLGLPLLLVRRQDGKQEACSVQK
jgi:hypothetical protein